MDNKKNRIFKTLMLVILTAFVTFMITTFSVCSYIEKNPKEINSLDVVNVGSNSSLQKYLKNIKSTIEKYYLWNDDIDEDKLETGAICGYVEALGDKYTEYIPAEQMEEYTEDITGNFVGVGVYMIADEDLGRIIVYYPIPESPAARAGIKSGDMIKSVDGVEYTTEQFDVIADNLKGEEGTTVNIVIDRNGEELSFDIVREKINTNPISIKLLDNKIGYLNLPSFDEETALDFKEKVDELKSQGAKSLIIDLRNNGGGIVNEATEIADFMLNRGNTIISTVDNKGERQVTISEKDPIITMPVVVLVNENSASSSEILACSLQENERAKIVGEKTYGKGIIQTLLSLSDGSGLKITTEEYYTPKGSKIHEVGIKPDEEVKLPESVKSVYSVKEEEDTQLKKAIEILK